MAYYFAIPAMNLGGDCQSTSLSRSKFSSFFFNGDVELLGMLMPRILQDVELQSVVLISRIAC